MRRILAVTLIGMTAAAVGPGCAAAAHAQNVASDERIDFAPSGPDTSALTGTIIEQPAVSATALYVRSWTRESRTTTTSPTSRSATPARATTSGPGSAMARIHTDPAGVNPSDTRPPLLGSTIPIFQRDTFFPVPVQLPVNSTQVITVKASGTYATVAIWQEAADQTWAILASTSAARIGSAGLAPGDTRVQNSDTTPTGTYTITQGFGVGADPGTRVPYHQVTDQDWWVEDPDSAYYNQMRTAAQGGFPLTQTGPDGSEHLVEYPVQYHNALVVDFNMDPAVPGRGAGIFLHDLGTQGGPTAGCVAVPADFLTRIMTWIDPAQRPVLAIG